MTRPIAAVRSVVRPLARAARAVAMGTAACLALATFAGAGAARAEPAIWVVKDKDSTIYLFGTVHTMRPQGSWLTPKIAKALNDSSDLTLEIADVDKPDPQMVQTLVVKYGVDREHPLSGKLDPKHQQELAEAAATLGLQPGQFEPMRPWLAGVQLTLAPLLKAGYRADAGVDVVLKGEAVKAGKPVAGFETLERQLRFLADLPPSVELDFLDSTLDDYAKAVTELDALSAAWEAGDVNKIAEQVDGEMKDESPALYQTLIVDRNIAWAGAIEQKLKGQGVSFIAVGAGHLAGPDSVQAQLAKHGIKATRF